MGYTSFTKEMVAGVIKEYLPKTVVDLGAQNDFSGPVLPAPYISNWYYEQGIEYGCIDLNGENGASVRDLSESFKYPGGWQADLVCDIGTSEHVGKNGTFDWEAIYNCWLNKHNLLKVGGIMVNENPAENNWPGHGYNYYTMLFYHNLSMFSNYTVLAAGEHFAMHNYKNGKNIWAILRKNHDEFISLSQFKKLGLKQL